MSDNRNVMKAEELRSENENVILILLLIFYFCGWFIGTGLIIAYRV